MKPSATEAHEVGTETMKLPWDDRPPQGDCVLAPATSTRSGFAPARPHPTHRLVAMWSGGSVVAELPARGQLVLGRGLGCDVVIAHGSVSRQHARLHLGSAPTLEDLGSSNGTWLDGRRLAPRELVRLPPGSLLELGGVLVVIHPPEEPTSPGDTAEIVLADEEMIRLYDLVDVVAKSGLSVVLMGETGVGKEVLASRLHDRSPRRSAPILKVNCAALVETLLEAELFGYEKGAFTGAATSKPGLLEGADGGTLFLDEIGELPLATQAKLLRVLETGEVMRIGSLRPRGIDVRFVSATNRDLRASCAQGRFRRDLFFRLDGVSVYVPPLRARTREIPALVERFVGEACIMHGRARLRVDDDALGALVHHAWPGNVRELKNVIGRTVLLAPGAVITRADLRFDPMNSGQVALGVGTDVLVPLRDERPTLPATSPPPIASPPLPLAGRSPPGAARPGSAVPLDAEGRARIVAALDSCGGNQTRAAKMLGISRRTMLKRLDAFGVARPRKDRDDEART